MKRRAARGATAFLTGAFMVSYAWAGAGLVPSADEIDAPAAVTQDRATTTAEPAPAPAPASVPDAASLPDGYVLAGAAKTSLVPRPGDYGGTWERSREVLHAQRRGL